MGAQISYMGTKRQIAPLVAQVVGRARPGPFLDCFSGMCAVAEELGTSRPVWTNDVQHFAASVGAALFTSEELPLSPLSAADLLFDEFTSHASHLRTEWAKALDIENTALSASTFDEFQSHARRLDAALKRRTARDQRNPRFSLFTRIYANTYIGVHQAIELDAVVCAVRRAVQRRRISNEQQRWIHIAVARGLLKVAATTGHFAQFLTANQHNFCRIVRQRKRSIWEAMLLSLDVVAPVGNASWRTGNRSFRSDATELLNSFRRKRARPAVVYADPPYTDDQYSRFYHLLETLVLYDYPKVTGKGLYRSSRFHTPFSLRANAVDAFEQLAGSIATQKMDLVLSYPTNGLLYKIGSDPFSIMKRHFAEVDLCEKVVVSHSTFGASKGQATTPVTEQIFLARA